MGEVLLQENEAEGFVFIDEADAELAKKEKKQIDFIESRLDYRNSEQVLAVYTKVIQDKMFKTPVGTIYLKHLQNFLLNKSGIEKGRISKIPVPIPCERREHEISRPVTRREPQRVRGNSNGGRSGSFLLSVLLNVLLIAAVIAMFTMTLKSDQPNILNYETALINRYAAWERELTEREQTIREKERELGISERSEP